MTPDLRTAAEAARDAYARDYPLRTADMHRADCDCLRCAMDALTAALDADGRGPKRAAGGVWVSDKEFWEDSDTPAPDYRKAVNSLNELTDADLTPAPASGLLKTVVGQLMWLTEGAGIDDRKVVGGAIIFIEQQAAELDHMKANAQGFCRDAKHAESVANEWKRQFEKEHERAEKFLWQVRDTCTRAEAAEAALAASEARVKVLEEALEHTVRVGCEYPKSPNCGKRHTYDCKACVARAALKREGDTQHPS